MIVGGGLHAPLVISCALRRLWAARALLVISCALARRRSFRNAERMEVRKEGGRYIIIIVVVVIGSSSSSSTIIIISTILPALHDWRLKLLLRTHQCFWRQ